MSGFVNFVTLFCDITTIGLSGFMKVPQINSIIKSKSTKGLSLASLLLELTSYTIMLSYNIYSAYPLVTYFEYPMMVLQDIVMLTVFLSFNGLMSPAVILPASGAMCFAYAICTGMLPHALITTLVGLCTPISASSKLVALLTIIRSKNSSTVSVSSWLISSYTCVTRIFTTYMDSADYALLLNFGTSFILNSMIVAAAIAYKPRKKED